MKSLHVLRSSTLLARVRSVDWTSEFCDAAAALCPWGAGGQDREKSSPESSAGVRAIGRGNEEEDLDIRPWRSHVRAPLVVRVPPILLASDV